MRFTIRNKLLLNLVAFIFTILLIIGILRINVSSFSSNVLTEMEDLSKVTRIGNEIMINVLEQLGMIQGYISTNNTKMVDRYYVLSTDVYKNIELYLELSLSDEESKQVQKIKVLHSRIEVLAGQVFALYELGKRTEVQGLLKNLQDEEVTLRNEVKTLNTLVQSRLVLVRDQFQSKLQTVIYLIIGVAIAAMVVGGVVSLSISRSITKSLSQLQDVIYSISTGDLTRQTTPLYRDEIGELVKTFNHFVQRLNSIIRQVVKSAEQVNAAVAQISTSSQQMAAGAESQTSQVTQISSAVKELASTALGVAKNAGEVATNSGHAYKIAQDSGEVIVDAVDGMKKISNVVSDSVSTVSTLVRRSEDIRAIVDVIEDIADQTNLLSLNAAIEAAVSGEEGRGFTVVAAEIRKLAEKTQQATNEVEQTISAIIHETEEAMKVMHKGSEQAETSIKLAHQTGKALNDIMSGTQQVNDMVQQIALSSDQQSTTTEQILENIEIVSRVIKETERGAHDLAQAAKTLSIQSLRLKDSISVFKLAKDTYAES